MKVLITGAHFTPAQATIEALKKLCDAKIVYIGRRYTKEGDNSPSAESQILPGMGVKFISLTTGRLQRTATFYTLTSILKIPVGFIQSAYFLVREKPDVVLSFGGYVAVPVVVVAWLLSIPIIIHEQTLVTDLTSRITSWFANKIAVSFNHSCIFDRKKTIITGNPIRREITEVSSDVPSALTRVITVAKKKRLPVVFVTGGNQGAHFINKLVIDSLNELLKIACVIHQTGDSKYKDFDKIQSLIPNLENRENYHHEIFFNARNMGYILKNSDLVICRGGINTLLEISYFAVPTVIIPIPNHKEQLTNALYFKKLGLARIYYQPALDPKKFLSVIKFITDNLSDAKKEAEQAKGIVGLDGASRLALETLLLV